MTPAKTAWRQFRALHDHPPDGVWSAPGRVNLIGEHTDYQDGLVLPFALPHRVAAAAKRRGDGMLTVATSDPDGEIRQAEPVSIDELAPGSVDDWAAYPASVAWVLRENGIPGGADIVLASDLETGAGLSSSAALECAVALALLGVHGAPEPDYAQKVRIARWAQLAENEFVGAPTGILDQMASLCCEKGHGLFLDVQSGATEQVPLDLTSVGLAVIVIDTRVKHSHSSSGYRDRRADVEQAAKLLGIPTLRDIDKVVKSGETIHSLLATLPSHLIPRAQHVITENQRVRETVTLLRAERYTDIGELLTTSHASLRDQYQVSCDELDVAVDTALRTGALGARMTGGGFGGSAIALIDHSTVDAVSTEINAEFSRRMWKTPRIFVATPSAGAGRDPISVDAF